jgi:succinyl-CoA synthetase alpha subunit
MAVIVDEDTRVVIQGITGHQGQFHAMAMKEYGTKVVAGVTPGKGGREVHGVPVYNTMEEAVAEADSNCSMLLVPARFAKDAAFEAIDSGIDTLVMITERIPFHDCLQIMPYARLKGVRVIGPNCPGVISPGKCKVGIMPSHIFREGEVGVISRSGTLTYEIVNEITVGGHGQSTCVGVGGDPIIGTSFTEALDLFEGDPQTKAVVFVGEIGGTAEEDVAERIPDVDLQVFAYVAGLTAPPGRRMGHAGAIISRGKGTADSKIQALEKAGARVARVPGEIAGLISETM